MLAEGTVIATIAVSDINRAREFYGETLGLKQVHEDMGGVMYQSGTGKLFIYESDTAGSGKATCANWLVADVEACVEALKQKGVTFEHYDIPGATEADGIYTMGTLKTGWFKDPDGNILGLSNEG